MKVAMAAANIAKAPDVVAAQVIAHMKNPIAANRAGDFKNSAGSNMVTRARTYAPRTSATNEVMNITAIRVNM